MEFEEFTEQLFTHHVKCTLDGIEKDFGVKPQKDGLYNAYKWWRDSVEEFKSKDDPTVSFPVPEFLDYENNVTDIEANMEHRTCETICVKCFSRQISVYPSSTLLKDLECETCGTGFIIKTGQDIEE